MPHPLVGLKRSLVEGSVRSSFFADQPRTSIQQPAKCQYEPACDRDKTHARKISSEVKRMVKLIPQFQSLLLTSATARKNQREYACQESVAKPLLLGVNKCQIQTSHRISTLCNWRNIFPLLQIHCFQKSNHRRRSALQFHSGGAARYWAHECVLAWASMYATNSQAPTLYRWNSIH